MLYYFFLFKVTCIYVYRYLSVMTQHEICNLRISSDMPTCWPSRGGEVNEHAIARALEVMVFN